MESAADRGLVCWSRPISPERPTLAGKDDSSRICGMRWWIRGTALEEAGAFGGCGNGAGVEASPDAIAPVRDQAVAEVAQSTRNDPQQGGEGRPRARQLAQHRQHRVGSDEHGLGRGFQGLGNQDGAGGPGCDGGIETVPGEKIGQFGRIGGDKAQTVVSIAGEEPAHRQIAEAADTVVDDQQAIADIFHVAHTYRDENTWMDDSIGLRSTGAQVFAIYTGAT